MSVNLTLSTRYTRKTQHEFMIQKQILLIFDDHNIIRPQKGEEKGERPMNLGEVISGLNWIDFFNSMQ